MTQHHLSAASIPLHESPDLPVLPPGMRLGLRAVGALDVENMQALVAVYGEEHTARWRSVASGPARLLVVGLDRGGNDFVHDRSHIGLVNAHAERVGGDDHGGGARHECLLRGGAGLGV